jgi:hypothetical protein
MADNTLSCQRETLHSQQLRSIKKSIDSDHGIYRDSRCLLAVHESGCGSAPRRRESSVEEESTRRVVD